MCLDFQTFQYSSRAKILIHHGDRTNRKDWIEKKQAYYIDNEIVKNMRQKCLLFTCLRHNSIPER